MATMAIETVRYIHFNLVRPPLVLSLMCLECFFRIGFGVGGLTIFGILSNFDKSISEINLSLIPTQRSVKVEIIALSVLQKMCEQK